jgi:hypothetical protein
MWMLSRCDKQGTQVDTECAFGDTQPIERLNTSGPARIIESVSTQRHVGYPSIHSSSYEHDMSMMGSCIDMCVQSCTVITYNSADDHTYSAAPVHEPRSCAFDMRARLLLQASKTCSRTSLSSVSFNKSMSIVCTVTPKSPLEWFCAFDSDEAASGELGDNDTSPVRISVICSYYATCITYHDNDLNYAWAASYTRHVPPRGKDTLVRSQEWGFACNLATQYPNQSNFPLKGPLQTLNAN